MDFRKFLPAAAAVALLFLPGAVGALYAPTPLLRLVWAALSGCIGGGAVVFCSCRIRRECWRGAAAGMLFLPLLAVTMLESVSWMISGKSFSYEFALHLSVNTLRYGMSGYEWPAAAAAVYLAGATVLTVWLFMRKCAFLSFRGARYAALPALLLLFLLPTPAGEALRFWGIRPLHGNPDASAADFERFGIKAGAVDRDSVAASPGKNLVLIYLESMEAAYLDERTFPGLMPNISRLQEEAVVFDNVIPAENAGFTVGAFYCSLAGFELTDLQLSGRHANNGINPAVGNRLSSLPGVLGKAGYFQSFMNSASLNFVGIYVILNEFGYADLWSAEALPEEARRQLGFDGLWGGCRDDMLLKLAFQKYLVLMREKQPFNLTLLTIDAHHPDGFVAKEGPVYALPGEKPSQLLTAIHRTDKALGEFIEALKRAPGWENTVVFITSDHLAMNGASTASLLRRNPDRRMLSFALNAGPPRRISVEGRTFDFAPTIAELLGVRHNYRFPQGESLLGRPDPRRLAGDSPEGRRVLEAYLQDRSGPAPRGAADGMARVVDSPYPALLIDGVPMPLFSQEFGILSYPQPGECFAVRLGSDGRTADWQRFGSPEECGPFLEIPGTYVLAGNGGVPGGPAEAGYYLAAGFPGAFRIVRAAGTPVGLALPLR